jgi:hypothetical protein
MTIKSFTTAARNNTDDGVLGEPVDVEVDGRTVTFLPPTTGQIAVTLAGSSEMATDSELAAAQINFFFSLLEKRDATWFRRRLFDRSDDFDIETIGEIVEYLMEQWSARPTKQPSDYLPSQRSGGKKSTAVRHRSTP